MIAPATPLPACCGEAFARDPAGACFSPERTHREFLWRRFRPDEPDNVLTAIMLNPSIADETALDPTLRRVARFADDWGHNGFIVVNAFSLVATQPSALYATHVRRADRVTDATPHHLRIAIQHARRVVLGWGKHLNDPRLQYRRIELLPMLQPHRERVFVLTTNTDGSPKHPLYVPADTSPQHWNGF